MPDNATPGCSNHKGQQGGSSHSRSSAQAAHGKIASQPSYRGPPTSCIVAQQDLQPAQILCGLLDQLPPKPLTSFLSRAAMAMAAACSSCCSSTAAISRRAQLLPAQRAVAAGRRRQQVAAALDTTTVTAVTQQAVAFGELIDACGGIGVRLL